MKSPPAKYGTVSKWRRNTKIILRSLTCCECPLSYRENRPAPLLVYLSGGAGFAIDGVNTAEDTVSDTDYLVLYPQAARILVDSGSRPPLRCRLE